MRVTTSMGSYAYNQTPLDSLFGNAVETIDGAVEVVDGDALQQ